MMKRIMHRWLRYKLLSLGTRVGIWLCRILPRPVGLLLFGFIGTCIYLIPHNDRKRTLTHLTRIYGTTWPISRIRKTARLVYREIGKNLFDSIYLTRLQLPAFDRIVHHDSLEALHADYLRGKGVVVITSHSGCFEMLLHFFPLHQYKSVAIGRKMHDSELDSIIRSNRSKQEVVYMDRSENPRKILRYLQQGRLFGVLIDQDTAIEGVFADFLGHLAYTPSGPIKMAMKFGIPVYVVTTARQKDNTHYLFVKGPLPLRSSEDFSADLTHNVALANSHICNTITAFPEQWVWMHRRWHRKPLKTPSESELEVA